MPHDYVCIGCEQLVSEHETVIESAGDRIRRDAPIGLQYVPLADNPQLAARVRAIAADIMSRSDTLTSCSDSAASV
jgi:hypothetical protein